jgi:hypothetical protein
MADRHAEKGVESDPRKHLSQMSASPEDLPTSDSTMLSEAMADVQAARAMTKSHGSTRPATRSIDITAQRVCARTSRSDRSRQ